MKLWKTRKKSPECMGEETTYLLAKRNDTKEPKNVRLITFKNLQTSNISCDR